MNFIEEYRIPDEVCDELMAYYEAETKHQGHCGGVCNLDVKDSMDCLLKDKDLYTKYVKHLGDCTRQYKEKYEFSKDLVAKWGVAEPINLQKYEPGGGFKVWHCERTNISNVKRHMVFMTYLNDVTDGGETAFFYQDVKFRPEKGKTLLWPADWTHTHKGIVSPTQVKYIATGWISFLDT